MSRPDVLFVSLASTAGLREADGELADSMRRAGASVQVVSARPSRDLPTMALHEFAWALSARRAAARSAYAGAVLYSSTTAALLWPTPGAIRFDSPAAANRPGRHGLWQRRAEARRFAQASLLVPWSEQALAEAPSPHAPAVVVPVAVQASGPVDGPRDIAAVTYAADAEKKGLDRVLAAWRTARRDGEELVVAGRSGPDEPGVRHVGLLVREDYRALLRRARVYVTAPRREDHGLAQLEALADGCLLVTTESPGPYVALPLARRLDARLVGDDLPRALRTALDDPRSGYPEEAQAVMEPLSRPHVDALVAKRLLPALLA